MGTSSQKRRRLLVLTATVIVLIAGAASWAFLSPPTARLRLSALAREGRKWLGWEKAEVRPEGDEFHEEVVLRKMEEASAEQDWRVLAPEYPRPKKLESLERSERLKAVKESAEFKSLDKEVKEYLKKKENLIQLEPPLPPVKETTDVSRLRDKGEEQVLAKLLMAKEKAVVEKTLEENVQLGIRGPLALRRIVERPRPPQVNVKMEAELEMTLWVQPNGTVDRVIPSVKGDAELERIAIQYLRQWRFAPLAKDHAQVEEWGIIPIKFRLQ